MTGATEVALFPYAVAFIGALLGALVAVIGWAGSQIRKELETLGTKVEQTNGTLNKIERDLRGELTDLDRRITRVESKCEQIHTNGYGQP